MKERKTQEQVYLLMIMDCADQIQTTIRKRKENEKIHPLISTIV